MLSLRKKLTGAVSQNYNDPVSGELVFCKRIAALRWEICLDTQLIFPYTSHDGKQVLNEERSG